MSQKDTEPLMNLSKETKTLVNQGVFSLFAIEATKPPQAIFLLCANSQNFLLDHDGVVVSTLENISTLKIKHPIKFPEIGMQTFSMGKLNYA